MNDIICAEPRKKWLTMNDVRDKYIPNISEFIAKGYRENEEGNVYSIKGHSIN